MLDAHTTTPPPPRFNPSVVQQIAAHLGETAPAARRQIGIIVRVLGVARTQAFVDQALAVEADGGMLLPDGSRKRTLGGVFFYLVRTHSADAEAIAINPKWRSARVQRHLGQALPRVAARAVPPAPASVPLPAFVWEEATQALTHPTTIGEARTVKITVVGRPAQIVERQGVIVCAMRSTTTPSLPKGLPPLPAAPTTYMVFIATKQWAKVKDALSNVDDRLVIEGLAVYEPRFAGITVYATQVTTTQLQAAKRQASVAE